MHLKNERNFEVICDMNRSLRLIQCQQQSAQALEVLLALQRLQNRIDKRNKRCDPVIPGNCDVGFYSFKCLALY